MVLHFHVNTVRIKKIGIPYSKAHCSIRVNICMWPIGKEQLIFFPLTEHIAIEDDDVISHFLQVLVIGWQTAVIAGIGNSDG